MKKFKICLCALAIFAASLLLVACKDKEKLKTFNVEEINVGTTELTYNGQSQAVEVDYEGVKNLKVTYCATQDGDFVPASSLNFVDADSYSVFYKLSAPGYNSYVSQQAIDFSILPKPINVVLDSSINENVYYNVNTEFNQTELLDNYSADGLIGNDVLNGLNWEIFADDNGDNFPSNRVDGWANDLIGKVYIAKLAGVQNPNYVLTSKPQTKLTLVDNVKVAQTGEETASWFKDLQTALTDVEDNSTLTLYADLSVENSIVINKNLTINGNGHSVTATVSDNFSNKENSITGKNGIFYITNGCLTLNNVEINGAGAVRGIRVETNSNSNYALKLGANAVVTNCLGTQSAAGVYATSKSSILIEGGNIFGNIYSDDEDKNAKLEFSADLWVGAEAKAEIAGGKVQNVWVNANSFSPSNNEFSLVVNAGECQAIYVEFDVQNNKTAKVKLTNAQVGSLMLGDNSADGYSVLLDAQNGEFESGTASVAE